MDQLTVIIPTLNEEGTIGDKIDNLLGNGIRREQIIVVDSDSSDRTAKIAESKGAKVINIEERGKIRGLNRGLSACETDIVALTDADALLTENSLKNSLKYLSLTGSEKGKKDIKAVSARALSEKKGNWLNRSQRYYQEWDSSLRVKESYLDTCCSLDGKFILLDKTALAAGKIKEQAYEDDLTLTLQLRKQSYRSIVAPDCTVVERNSESVTQTLRQIARRTKLSIMTMIRHRQLLFNAKQGSFGLFILPSRRGFNMLLPFYLAYVVIYLIFFNPLVLLSASILLLVASFIFKRVNIPYNTLIALAMLLAWLQLLLEKPEAGGIWKKNI